MIARNLRPGARVFLQSDIQEVAEDMTQSFMANDSFEAAQGYDIKSLHLNPSPFDVPTEREVATMNKLLPVYRMLFVRA